MVAAALGPLPCFAAEKQLAEAQIIVDVANEIGIINYDIAGRLTQTKPEWLDTLPATYIRHGWGGEIFHHMKPWPAEGQYDWDKVDALIESYLERGIEVHLPICYMPEWLWSSEATEDQAPGIFPFMKKGNTQPPSSYVKWEELIYQTVKHLNVDKQYGVMIECWNEPDADWFWNGTKEEYFKLYEHTARGVKRADPDTLVGGPGLTHARMGWLEPFIKHCAENDVPLDFITWHGYLVYALWDKAKQTEMKTSPGEAGEWRSLWQDPVMLTYTEQVARIREILKQYPSVGEPLLINSEWGYSWNQSEPDESAVNKSAYHAAFTAQSMLEMMDSGMSAATFCSYMGEIDSPWPVYHTFKMFGMLEPKRISASVEEEHSGVQTLASRNDDSVSVLLWNFPSRIPVIEGKVRRAPYRIDRKSPFRQPSPADKAQKPVRLNLQNLPAGEYSFTRYLVDDEHSGKDLVKVDEGTLQAGGKAELSFEMLPNAVSFIQLRTSK